MIAILSYGTGNVRAFANVYQRLNIRAVIATTADDLRQASKIILPGVGAFDSAMQQLESSGMRDVLIELVLDKKKPVLGVCVGMQMLANGSDEGACAGLGWIPGRVRRFAPSPNGQDAPLPHMGWNDVRTQAPHGLFKELEEGARFYFLHSFYFDCEKPANVAATCSYGVDFACAVAADNIMGVQFHPEKSHGWGARLLKNFAELPC